MRFLTFVKNLPVIPKSKNLYQFFKQPICFYFLLKKELISYSRKTFIIFSKENFDEFFVTEWKLHQFILRSMSKKWHSLLGFYRLPEKRSNVIIRLSRRKFNFSKMTNKITFDIFKMSLYLFIKTSLALAHTVIQLMIIIFTIKLDYLISTKDCRIE